jgi:hypothetical protein
MPRNGRLRAWIEPRDDARAVAAFVGATATAVRRAQATRLCASQCEAKRWIEAEATGIGTPACGMGGTAGIAGRCGISCR